jgi:flagellar motor switch protein FliM
LPASAACVVANGVRETLTSLLGAPVAMRLFEPTIPVPSAWQAILRDAILYRVRGSVADAAMILRPPDACALARAVFAEPPSASAELQPLSPIERDVVDRTATAIASNLGALCGVRNGHAERVGTIGGFVSFFELLLEKPIDARIGIAISRDPSPERRGALDLAQLAEVRFAAVASLDLGNVSADAVACLAPGAILAIHSSELRRCTLKTSGRRLARGSCGVRNGRYAITTEAIFEI